MTMNRQRTPGWNLNCFDSDDLLAIFDSSKQVVDSKPSKKATGIEKIASLNDFDPLLSACDSRDDQGIWSNDYRTAELREIDCQVDDSIAKRERNMLRNISRKSLSSSKLSESLGLSNKRTENKQVTPPSSPPATPKRKHKKGSDATSQPRDTTPWSSSKSIRKLIVSKLSPVRRKSMGSPKSQPGTPSSSTKGPRSMIAAKLSPAGRRKSVKAPDLDIPSLVKAGSKSFLKDAVTMAYRTSEQDPSPHQVAIPTSQELLQHSRLCALLDSCRKLGDQNFDFKILKGISRLKLKTFLSLDHQSIPGLTPEQKPVIQAFLDCADDIEVEGFFTHGDNGERSEVGVFSTRNRFIVVYRGTTEQQLKPVRAKRSAVNLDPENPVSVYPPFRDAYFELETKVYGLLDTLVDTNPFCDVVFTGHSFGGALATIGAVRFASARPMLRFCCHSFGSPKVGAHNFRQMVNTLPNLKVMRVEYGSDPNTNTPVDGTKWEHVGHTLAIQGGRVSAYRFDNKKPSSASLLTIRKPENDIQAYVRAMEPFATSEVPWVTLYVGEDVGEGVLGRNNSMRMLA
jgi:hypothetical protein